MAEHSHRDSVVTLKPAPGFEQSAQAPMGLFIVKLLSLLSLRNMVHSVCGLCLVPFSQGNDSDSHMCHTDIYLPGLPAAAVSTEASCDGLRHMGGQGVPPQQSCSAREMKGKLPRKAVI